MSKDWVGGRNSIYTTIGASNHVVEDRAENDFYATSPYAAEVLLNETGECFSNTIWEPACGTGELSRRIEELGFKVFSSDLVNRGYGQGGVDFLQQTALPNAECDIITNPPYKYATEFIEHSMDILPEGHKAAFFLKLTFLEGKGRKQMFQRYHPRVYVSSSRIPCAKNGDFEALKQNGGSAVGYAWYVFEKGYSGRSYIQWVN